VFEEADVNNAFEDDIIEFGSEQSGHTVQECLKTPLQNDSGVTPSYKNRVI